MKNKPQTIATLLKTARQAFAGMSASPQLDAEILLSHVLNKDRAYLLTWPEKVVTSAEMTQFVAMVTRRAQGEPVAYLLGRRAFWSLDLKVTPDTLIPRPETEQLVEKCLCLLADLNSAHVVDLGTGSGAIALALAQERPSWHIVAVDKSQAALAVAQRNAQWHGISNVEFKQGQWCDALIEKKSYDAIVSNPPYIAVNDEHLNQGDLRFEPREALAAGPTGLEAIRVIIKQAAAYLRPKGWLILEHGYDQAIAITDLLTDYGYNMIQTERDYAGIERMTYARMC